MRAEKKHTFDRWNSIFFLVSSCRSRLKSIGSLWRNVDVSQLRTKKHRTETRWKLVRKNAISLDGGATNQSVYFQCSYCFCCCCPHRLACSCTFCVYTQYSVCFAVALASLSLSISLSRTLTHCVCEWTRRINWNNRFSFPIAASYSSSKYMFRYWDAMVVCIRSANDSVRPNGIIFCFLLDACARRRRHCAVPSSWN